MRFATIDGGVVVNVSVGNMGPDGAVQCPDDVGIGWLYADGTFTAPPPAPVPVPSVVTMRQARLALLAADKLDAVDAAVAAQDRATRITWEYAQEVRRDNELLAALAPTLGLDDVALDALFVQAAAL